LGGSGGRLGGLICNSRMTDREKELTDEFAKAIGTKLLYFLPRDNIVQKAELNRKTVIEYAPGSAQADVYRELARTLAANEERCVPAPLSYEALETLLNKYN
jgi:nitrogenase iron protein NifH